jgi:alpha-L-fucosidase
MMKMCAIAACIFLSFTVVLLEGNATAGDTPETAINRAKQSSGKQAERDHRMRWWREARFGMFIHWGLYAAPAGEYKGLRSERIGEWIMDWANIPLAEYEKFAPQFNPVKFNAAEWARLAKQAGMKYIVITSKHHDGFSMYDSRVSKYDIVDATPYGRDPMRALAAAQIILGVDPALCSFGTLATYWRRGGCGCTDRKPAQMHPTDHRSQHDPCAS